MPEILSLALFERGSRVLVTHRKAERSPFAGQWLLPAGRVESDDSAEQALERHVFHELNVEIGEPAFVETLYLEDADGRRYVLLPPRDEQAVAAFEERHREDPRHR